MADLSKKSVALSSVFASAGLTVIKAIVGVLTGSMGILSEAAHSALDLGAATLTYFAVSVGDKPADSEHHYGHGKIESISAFIETLLLFVTSGWIIYESVGRLLARQTEIKVEWYSFAVMAVSIIVDISRSRALSRVAKRTGSQALEADALHFSSDIWSSAAVIVGLVFVLLDVKGADSIAALVVAVTIIYVGIRLGKRTIDVLIDTAPTGITEKITQIAKRTDGVVDIEKLKIRPVGLSVFIEMILVVNRKLPFLKVDLLIEEIEEKIKVLYPEAEMTISAKPIALNTETVTERIHIVARNHNASVYNIAVILKSGKKTISFDVEVDRKLSVKEAHDAVSHLENEIKKEIGEDMEISSHIEPINRDIIKQNEVTKEERVKIVRVFNKICGEIEFVRDIHDINIVKSGKKYFVHVHSVFTGSLSIEKAHEVASQIEELAKKRMPDLEKVVVHTEPKEV